MLPTILLMSLTKTLICSLLFYIKRKKKKLINGISYESFYFFSIDENKTTKIWRNEVLQKIKLNEIKNKIFRQLCMLVLVTNNHISMNGNNNRNQNKWQKNTCKQYARTNIVGILKTIYRNLLITHTHFDSTNESGYHATTPEYLEISKRKKK